MGTVEGWVAGSSSVDGPEGGRRPVAPSYRALQAELLSSTSRRDTDIRHSSKAYKARPQSEFSKSRATFLEINWLSLPLAGESCFHFFSVNNFQNVH